jgi:DNA-binding XRE family transcriptional regulator
LTAYQPPWNRYGYQRLVRVAWEAPDLVAVFEDGTRARLAGERLLLPDDGPVAWSRLTWSPYEIAVPGSYEVVIIPSSRVRLLTDAAYAAHLTAAAEAEARAVGQRLRELREARGLAGEELAARAGVTANSLALLERGEHDASLPDIEPLLAAMGCTLDDLLPDDVLTAGEPSIPR